jgi:hypothetical protein
MEINLVFSCSDFEKEIVVPINDSQIGLIPNVGDYLATGDTDRRKVRNRSFAYGDKEAVVILEFETAAEEETNQARREAAATRVREFLWAMPKHRRLIRTLPPFSGWFAKPAYPLWTQYGQSS